MEGTGKDEVRGAGGSADRRERRRESGSEGAGVTSHDGHADLPVAAHPRGKVVPGRMTAAAAGEITVFLIGLRINRFRDVRSWWPALSAMPRMLRELTADPHSGLLAARNLLGGPRLFYVVQYWESHEKLLAYASAPDQAHRPAWSAFNRGVRRKPGAVGIWHETYVVPAGNYETLYGWMPPIGLGQATGVVPVGRRGERAAERLAGVRPQGA